MFLIIKVEEALYTWHIEAREGVGLADGYAEQHTKHIRAYSVWSQVIAKQIKTISTLEAGDVLWIT